MIVIHELDHQKHQTEKPNLKYMARNAVREINRCMNTEKDKIEIYNPKLSFLNEESYKSVYSINDDIILATVQELNSERSEIEHILVSNDYGMSLKAEGLKIHIMEYEPDVIYDKGFKGFIEIQVNDDFIQSLYKEKELNGLMYPNRYEEIMKPLEESGQQLIPNAFYELVSNINPKVRLLMFYNSITKTMVKLKDDVKYKMFGGITPKNKEQKYFTHLLKHTDIPCIQVKGSAGCLLGDTEVLTPQGWIKIKDYNSEQIAEFNPINKTVRFNTPIAYHKYKADEFYNLDGMIVSINHNNLIVNEDNTYSRVSTEDIIKNNKDIVVLTEGDKLSPINFTKKTLRAICFEKVKIENNEQMYCFTTRTGYFVMKQNGVVYATGNSGKAQPVYSKVLSENGWTTIGELKIGDRIYGEDGNLYNVLNIFDKGIRNSYKITFSDGSSTECCGEHLWTFIDRDNHVKTLELNYIITISDKSRLLFPINKPINYTKKDCPLIPYVAGILVNDKLNNEDSHIQINEYLKDIGILPSQIKTQIDNFVLSLNNDFDKTINTYIKSSIDDRDEFLAGMLLGKMKNTKTNPYIIQIFDVKNKILGDIVEEVAKSLGRRMTYSYVNNKHIVTEHIIGHLTIKNIEKTEKSVPMKCIYIDNPSHLYITDQYIVTHNTLLSLAYAMESLSNDGFKTSNVKESDLNRKFKKFLYIKSLDPVSQKDIGYLPKLTGLSLSNKCQQPL